MLRVLAVDDEVPALEELSYLLREDPRVEWVGGAGDAACALRDLSRMLVAGERLDAVFLDIRMPGLDGLDFTRLLAGFAAPPEVVFVTAHDDCAVAAYELGALDYLLKPVRRERLAEAVRRVDEAVARARANGDPAAGPADAADEDEMIPVELGGRTRLVSRRSVTHVEAQGDYVRLHTADGSYLVRMPLASLARRWEDSGFIRIHRSTLVASQHITELRFDGGRAAVQIGDELLPVSRRHTRAVRDLLVRRFRQADPPDSPAPRPDTARPDITRPDTVRAEGGRSDDVRSDAARADAARRDVVRPDAVRADGARPDTARSDAARSDAARSDAARSDAARSEGGRGGGDE
ncbi:LytR/AlgR family response regulator transcription factor [Actinomadura gamaensis]|uniref:LytR/AlgR family response regulator transcription factor n=1 Tax=Actinomadura gamaensis TaxID=1763541 RepID=A0ABV9TUJ0_9ACTN